MMVDFSTLVQTCAPAVAPATMAAIVRAESGFNPYAIGVAQGHLARQPRNLAEAVATVRLLERAGYDYSVGLAQINRANFTRYRLTPTTAFEPCRNLAVGADILSRCFARAERIAVGPQQALRASLSCYTSGDFMTGYRTGYVQRVVADARLGSPPRIPAIDSDAGPIPVIAEPLDRRPRDQSKTDRSHDPPQNAPAPDASDARVF